MNLRTLSRTLNLSGNTNTRKYFIYVQNIISLVLVLVILKPIDIIFPYVVHEVVPVLQ